MTNIPPITGGTFADALAQPDEAPTHAYVMIDFARPDGTIYCPESEYDMLSSVDIETINKNLTDGYRIVRISIA